MLKVMDKLKNKANNNKKIITFLVGISLIGFIFGTIFILFISKNDQSLIKEYINSFMLDIGNNKLNYIDTLKNTIISNLVFITVIWLLGISIIGIPIIIIMYFYKSFVIGFSFSSFVLIYKSKGILYSLIYVFPHHIINLISYTLLMVYAIKFSLLLFSNITKKRETIFKNIMNKYILIFLVVISITICTSLMETFLMPLFLNKIYSVLN